MTQPGMRFCEPPMTREGIEAARYGTVRDGWRWLGYDRRMRVATDEERENRRKP